VRGRAARRASARRLTAPSPHPALRATFSRKREKGTHGSLLAANGLYARLARLQFETGAAALTAMAEAAQ